MASSLPSSYALKYGIHAGAPFGPGKSGLTPVDPSFRNAEPSVQKLRDLSEKYQRKVLCGFTSQELQDLDCLTNRQLLPNDLANEIWPIFQQSRWSEASSPSTKYIPRSELDESTLGADQYGRTRADMIPWNGSDPRIWEHLEPCLRLACQILSRVHSLPWFDALVAENYQPILPSRFSPEDILASSVAELQKKYRTFRPRTQDERATGPNSRETLRNLIYEVLLPRLKLGFASGAFDLITGRTLGTVSRNACQMIRDGNIWIFLSCEYFMPLMRQDLTSSERLTRTFQVAKTVVHEFMVSWSSPCESTCLTTITHATRSAIQYYSRGTGAFKGFVRLQFEPYYEQEQENELGESCEQALFGGRIYTTDHTHLPIAGGDTAPDIVVFVGPFPSGKSRDTRTAQAQSGPVLIDPPIPDSGFLNPLPVTFHENLNSDAFWNVHVRAMGLNAIQAPKALGTVQVNTRTTPIPPEDYRRAVEEREAVRLAGLTPRERSDHARFMRNDFVATYEPLTHKRDRKVRELKDQADIVRLHYTDHLMYLSIVSKFLVLIEELWDIHKQIFGMISMMETEAGGILLDTRRSILSFHLDFLLFVVEHSGCPIVDGQLQLDKVVSNLDQLVPRQLSTMTRQQQLEALLHLMSLPQVIQKAPAGNSFINSAELAIYDFNKVSSTLRRPPMALAPPFSDYYAILEQAVNSTNDKDKLKLLCEQILSSMVVEIHLRAVARILYTTTTVMTTQEMLHEIRISLRVLGTIAPKDRNCFGPRLKFDDMVKLGYKRQTEVEELLRAEQASVTIVCQ